MKSLKSIGPSTLPCGIPLVTSAQFENFPFTENRWRRFVRNSFIHAKIGPVIPKLEILEISLLLYLIILAISHAIFPKEGYEVQVLKLLITDVFL